MIRKLVEQTFDSTKKYLKMAGLSTDSKPTSGLITGSRFYEVDTGGEYAFDEVSAAWTLVGMTSQAVKNEIDAWLEENIDPDSGYALDRTLSLSNAAAPADLVGDLKSALKGVPYAGRRFTVSANSHHSSSDDRAIVNIQQGEQYKILFDAKDRASQFYAYYTDGTSGVIATSGTASKAIDSIGVYINNSTFSDPVFIEFMVIRNPVGIDLYNLQTETVPNLAKIISNSVTDITGNVWYEWTYGKTRDIGSVFTPASYSNWSCVIVPCVGGDLFSLSGSGGNNSRLWNFVDGEGASISASATQAKSADYLYITAPSGSAYLVCNSKTNDTGYTPRLVKGKAVQNRLDALDGTSTNMINPVLPSVGINWRNGSAFNTYNQNFISPTDIMPVMGASKIVCYADIPLAEGESVFFYFCTFTIDSGNVATDGNTHRKRVDIATVSNKKIAVYDFIDGDIGFTVYISKVDSNGDYVPLRIETTDTDRLSIARYYYNNPQELEIKNEISSARHIPGRDNTIQPLTLMHFSDIHADRSTYERILSKAKAFADSIDDKICTGDISGNSYSDITGWWQSNVLTCIGNHDTASYADGVYNWTYLSMAQRDQYYIAPFESNWNLPAGAHTTGTSYYYKDYDDAKVRMIVLDAMLYTDNTTATEATAQTEWLASLMAETLDDQESSYGYHVLIAIHSPHGGSAPVDCTFTQDDLGTMPTYNDCNTPDEIINTVATAIANGVHFVGYICGHTHWDAVYKATEDGTQLMYCVTCAIVSTKNQWVNADMARNVDMDAFNIVTIDTVNSLVKIVRAGGANIDRNMRSRKAICFNYSTGEKVHEVT